MAKKVRRIIKKKKNRLCVSIGGRGFLVSVKNPKKLKDGLKRLLDRAEKRKKERLGQNKKLKPGDSLHIKMGDKEVLANVGQINKIIDNLTG